MSEFDQFKMSFNDSVNSVLNPVFNNDIAKAAIILFASLYGGLIAPKIPTSLAPVFSNTIFKIVFMALVAWIANHDPVIALVISICYFLTITYLTKNVFVEAFSFSTVTDNLKSVLGVKKNVDKKAP